MSKYAVYIVVVEDTDEADMELADIAIDIERVTSEPSYKEAREVAYTLATEVAYTLATYY